MLGGLKCGHSVGIWSMIGMPIPSKSPVGATTNELATYQNDPSTGL